MDLGNDESEQEHGLIVSVGQLPTKKNHEFQLQMMRVLRKKYGDVKCRLVMIGGARNEGDRQRAARLRESAENEGLVLTVRVNVSGEELRRALKVRWIGVHTIHGEYSGITVV